MHDRLGVFSDAELVALVADEHRDALAESYRRHAGWVVARDPAARSPHPTTRGARR